MGSLCYWKKFEWTTLLQLIPVSHTGSEKAHGRKGLKGWKLCLHHCLRVIEKGWPLFNRTAGPGEDSPCLQAGLALLLTVLCCTPLKTS